MFFQLIPVNGSLWVEGHSDVATIGEFSGHVLAVGVRDYDPVASPPSDRPTDAPDTEGLLGWGNTYFLVCDPDKPAPVWVAKVDLSGHAYDAAPPVRSPA